MLGARPLRRAIQRDIEDVLSEKILFGDIHAKQRIVVDAEGEGLLGNFTFRGEDVDHVDKKAHPDHEGDTVEQRVMPTAPDGGGGGGGGQLQPQQ